MNKSIDGEKTIEIIERLQLAQIGEYKKWEKIIRKIKNEEILSPSELGYFTNFTRIYKKSETVNRSKIYHTKLSEQDIKPKCTTCGEKSDFYCNMNDQYFYITHVVGDDGNEF